MIYLIGTYFLGYIGFLASIIKDYDVDNENDVKSFKKIALIGLFFYFPIFVFVIFSRFFKGSFIYIRDLRD